MNEENLWYLQTANSVLCSLQTLCSLRTTVCISGTKLFKNTERKNENHKLRGCVPTPRELNGAEEVKSWNVPKFHKEKLDLYL